MDKPQEDNKPIRAIYAVVYSGSLRVITQVPDSTKPGDIITVDDACELITSIIPVPAPGGQGVAIMFRTEVKPMDNSRGAVIIRLQVNAIRFFVQMEKEEANGYLNMVEQMKESLQIARAKALGIEIPIPIGGGGGIVPGRA